VIIKEINARITAVTIKNPAMPYWNLSLVLCERPISICCTLIVEFILPFLSNAKVIINAFYGL
jgi:hypothetical protein